MTFCHNSDNTPHNEPIPLSFFDAHKDQVRNAQIERTRKDIDELLVYGYIKREYSKTTQQFTYLPLDIINTCLIWYHSQNCLIFSAGNEIEILDDDENNIVATHKGNSYNSCYGSIVMPSLLKRNINYEYTVKILKNSKEISIGIDDSKCQHINNDFSGHYDTRNYAYFSMDGTQYNCSTGYEYWGIGKKYGESYTTGDTIKMCFNPYNSTLQFWKNGIDQGVIKNIHGHQDLNYRLCIYMGYKPGTKVQIITNP